MSPLLADLFLYYHEADFIQEHFRKKDKKLAIYFNSTFRYIDDDLSLNNSKCGDYVECIYPIELLIKDTTDTVKYSLVFYGVLCVLMFVWLSFSFLPMALSVHCRFEFDCPSGICRPSFILIPFHFAGASAA